MKKNPTVKLQWNTLSVVWKLRISFTVLIALFILALTTLSHTSFKRIFYNRRLDDFNARIDLADIACQDLISYAQQFSKLLLLSDEIQEYFDTDASTTYANRIKNERAAEIRFDYAEGSRRNNEFSLLAAFNINLESAVFSGAESMDSKQAYQSFYEACIRDTKSASWLSIPSSEYTHTNLCYASPYFDFKTGRLIGHLVIFYDLNSLQALLHPVFSSTIAQYSVLSDGEIILSSEDRNSTFNGYIENQGENMDDALKEMRGHGYWAEYHSIQDLPITIISFEPESVLLQDMNTMNRMIILSGIVFLVLATLLASLIADSFTKPITVLTEAMQRFGNGEDVHVETDRNDEIGVLQSTFNSMTMEIRTLINQVYDEQRKRRKFELNAIQAQINPHFLYNTLNSICSLIVLNNNTAAYQMITNLSAFYRTALSSGQTLIPLSDELKNVDSYLQIQSIRFQNSFTWEIKSEPSIHLQQIVKLTLQPLVENSLLHAFEKDSTDNHIDIICQKITSDQVQIRVHDNGQGIPAEKLDHLFDQNLEKFGLYSIRERLRLYFNDSADLTVHSSPNDGTTFTIILPDTQTAGGTL